MPHEGKEDLRARDDAELARLVGEGRARLAARGLAEKPLDWGEIIRRERAAWWRERLRQALGGLGAAAGRGLAALVRGPETLAAAALELTLDAAAGIGRLDPLPASACTAPEARMEFAYASPAVRTRHGIPEAQEDSIGVFVATGIPGAQVVADARARTVAVELLEPVRELTILLVPEDPAEAVRVERAGEQARLAFADLPPGRYLLAAYLGPGEGA